MHKVEPNSHEASVITDIEFGLYKLGHRFDDLQTGFGCRLKKHLFRKHAHGTAVYQLQLRQYNHWKTHDFDLEGSFEGPSETEAGVV